MLTSPVAKDAALSWSSIPMRYATAPATDPGGVLVHRQAKQIFEFLAAGVQPLVLVRPSLARCPAVASLRERLPVPIVESPRGLRDPAWTGCQDLTASADRVVLVGPADLRWASGKSVPVHRVRIRGGRPALLGALAALLAGWPYRSRCADGEPVPVPAPLADATLPVHPMTWPRS